MLPLVHVEKSRVEEAKDCAIELPIGPDINLHDAHKSNSHKVVDIEVHVGNGHLNLGMLQRVVGVLGGDVGDAESVEVSVLK